MADIKIPFKEWSIRELRINKFVTSRPTKYGQPGDTFIVENMKFEINHVEKVTLGFVANVMFEAEGVSSPDEFIEAWNEIHPRKKFDPDQMVFLHVFTEINNYGEVE